MTFLTDFSFALLPTFESTALTAVVILATTLLARRAVLAPVDHSRLREHPFGGPTLRPVRIDTSPTRRR